MAMFEHEEGRTRVETATFQSCFTSQSSRKVNVMLSLGQSILVSSPIWGCQTVSGLLIWGVLSDERTGRL
jgi:hypothetical protein